MSGYFATYQFSGKIQQEIFSKVNLALIPVFKPHTYKLYILRHCTNIVYKDFVCCILATVN